MSGCVYKLPDGRCNKPGRYLMPCIGEACASQTPSNYDRIVSMTPEEMANEIIKIVAFCAPGQRPSPDCCCNCQQCWVEWLRRPVEVDNGT